LFFAPCISYFISACKPKAFAPNVVEQNGKEILLPVEEMEEKILI
jgi:hypothetical protein